MVEIFLEIAWMEWYFLFPVKIVLEAEQLLFCLEGPCWLLKIMRDVAFETILHVQTD